MEPFGSITFCMGGKSKTFSTSQELTGFLDTNTDPDFKDILGVWAGLLADEVKPKQPEVSKELKDLCKHIHTACYNMTECTSKDTKILDDYNEASNALEEYIHSNNLSKDILARIRTTMDWMNDRLHDKYLNLLRQYIETESQLQVLQRDLGTFDFQKTQFKQIFRRLENLDEDLKNKIQ